MTYSRSGKKRSSGNRVGGEDGRASRGCPVQVRRGRRNYTRNLTVPPSALRVDEKTAGRPTGKCPVKCGERCRSSAEGSAVSQSSEGCLKEPPMEIPPGRSWPSPDSGGFVRVLCPCREVPPSVLGAHVGHSRKGGGSETHSRLFSGEQGAGGHSPCRSRGHGYCRCGRNLLHGRSPGRWGFRLWNRNIDAGRHESSAPGNRYVTEASGSERIGGIDMLAGPSEVVIIADGSQA